MKNILLAFVFALFVGIATTNAHVVVGPNTVKPAAFQVFTVSVPVEKDIPTTAIRIVLPEGLNHISPTVKLGWTVETKKVEDTITEISWIGGTIPAGQRDEFSFSAQVPSEEKVLTWKAYQTYANGIVVSWDQESEPAEGEGERVSGPYSTTAIQEDLTEPVSAPLWLGVVGVLLGVAGVVLSLRK